TLRLYEENLIAGKSRQKTGDVVVGKRVETETQHVSIPVEKERVVIERVAPTDATVAAGADAFQEGEVVRVEVYEETPEIRKETVLREEVRVRKEIDRETVEADETVRRERLDVDQQGNPIVRE
ncbi:MAG: YsnF/AvaK domain-containing protein, partial [Elainella sp.]